MQILSSVKVGKLTLCLIPPVKSLDAVLLCYGCEGRHSAVIASKRARKSGGGVEGKFRRSTVILSSTCEVLKECDHEDVAEFVLATSDDARVTDGRKVRGGFHWM